MTRGAESAIGEHEIEGNWSAARGDCCTHLPGNNQLAFATRLHLHIGWCLYGRLFLCFEHYRLRVGATLNLVDGLHAYQECCRRGQTRHNGILA